jgi:hypothetical protein
MARTILYLDCIVQGYDAIAGDFNEQVSQNGDKVMVSNTAAGAVVIASSRVVAALTYIPNELAYGAIDPAALVIS